MSNYAFIDAQNLNSGLHKLAWKIDWKRFRQYLAEERNIEVAYVFIGFMLDNQDLYLVLQKAGFVVVFKEVYTNQAGDVKGNIDAELILQAMIDYDRYDRALIVSGDGDFTCLLRYLEQNGKLEGVIAPYEKSLSSLIQRAAEGKIEYLRSLRKKVEYRPSARNPRSGPKPEMVPFQPNTQIEAKTPPKKQLPQDRPRILAPRTQKTEIIPIPDWIPTTPPSIEKMNLVPLVHPVTDTAKKPARRRRRK